MTQEDQIRLVASSSPHAHSGASVRRIMLDVVIALVPAMAFAFVRFGWDAVRLVSVCVAACMLTEVLCRKAMRRDAGIQDMSAVVTGILLAFNLPPSLPTWIAVIGCIFAVAIAKQVFGGIGYNPFNPALAARVALLASFPVQMTVWSKWVIPSPIGIDGVTTATPLGLVKSSLSTTGTVPFTFDGGMAAQLFVGNVNGCIGEVSAAALLLGGLYLLWRRCISWHTPVAYFGSIAIFSGVLYAFNSETNMPPMFHLLSGGLVLGAVFMATDMVTTPVTRRGQLVFGVGCGVITMVIRKWGGFPEGVSFSILLMNAVTPLINRATVPRRFGAVRAGKPKAGS